MDVSDRLRVHAGSVLTTTDRVLVEAADEIDRLRAENERLREALEELRYACTDKAMAMADAALVAGGEE